MLVGGIRTGCSTANHMTSNHVSILTGDDLLRKFGEIEDDPGQSHDVLSSREIIIKAVYQYTQMLQRWQVHCSTTTKTRCMGESRAQAVRHFLSLERSLHFRGKFKAVDEVIQEYFELGHAELVPIADLNKPPSQVFYLPVHAVEKESSATTKICPVFNASAKS